MARSKKKKHGARIIAIVLVILAVLVVFLAPQVTVPFQKMRYPIKYEEQVTRWAQEYQVDPNLVYAFIFTESGFKPKAESSADARGLMQMTDETFEWIKTKIAPNEDITFEDMYVPEHSIRFGTYYLALSLEKYDNDVSTVAAAYHSGWGEVDTLLANEKYSKDGVRLTDTPYKKLNHYMYKINKGYQKYTVLYSGKNTFEN